MFVFFFGFFLQGTFKSFQCLCQEPFVLSGLPLSAVLQFGTCAWMEMHEYLLRNLSLELFAFLSGMKKCALIIFGFGL